MYNGHGCRRTGKVYGMNSRGSRIGERGRGAITGVAALPNWGFDGSSTNQATGDDSDCQLFPVFACRDPLRGGDNLLVLCEVVTHGGTPHPTNTRRATQDIEERTKSSLDCWYGFEQEYTMMKDGYPLGFPEGGYPGPQGPYYCGVGTGRRGGTWPMSLLGGCRRCGGPLGRSGSRLCGGDEDRTFAVDLRAAGCGRGVW